MKIDTKTLHKIAHLARLEVQPAEEAALLQDLNSVLTWMEQLAQVDTTGVAPLMHMAPDTHNQWRTTDEVANQLPRAQALCNAPDHTDEFVRVPKVMA